MSVRHVIIGAGPAGVTAAETIRRHAADAHITLLGDEPELPYSRMAIPYLLVENINEQGTHLRKRADHFDSHGIDVKRGRVRSVDTDGKTLELADGGRMQYDRLLIATGATPITPPIDGIDLAGVHPCWTLEDARAIAKLAKPGANVVLIGAGFIACIVLEALRRREVNLVVVEAEDRMLPRMMNNTAAAMLQAWCERRGVSVRVSTRVQAIAQDGKNLKVRLSDGSSLPADLVISAVGVRSNTDFLANTPVKVNDGVVVNDTMRSTHPDIYAAGDAAEGADFSTRQLVVQAIQPTAVEHGRIAGLNMAGKETAHEGGVNMNVLDTMGLVSTSFGLWMGVDGGETAESHEPDRQRYLNLQFEDDVLVGASSVGLTQHVGVLRGLIQSRLRLRDWKDKLMQNPTRVMEAYLARAQVLAYRP